MTMRIPRKDLRQGPRTEALETDVHVENRMLIQSRGGGGHSREQGHLIVDAHMSSAGTLQEWEAEAESTCWAVCASLKINHCILLLSMARGHTTGTSYSNKEWKKRPRIKWSISRGAGSQLQGVGWAAEAEQTSQPKAVLSPYNPPYVAVHFPVPDEMEDICQAEKNLDFQLLFGHRSPGRE